MAEGGEQRAAALCSSSLAPLCGIRLRAPAATSPLQCRDVDSPVPTTLGHWRITRWRWPLHFPDKPGSPVVGAGCAEAATLNWPEVAKRSRQLTFETLLALFARQLGSWQLDAG